MSKEIMKVKYVKGFNDTDSLIPTQNCIGRFTYHWIHMDRINGFYVWMFIADPANGPEHMLHRLTKIFPTMSCDHNKSASFCPIKLLMSIIITNCGFQCIDCRISRYINRFRLFSLLNQILSRQFCRGKIIRCYNTNRLTVKFFRIRRIDIIGS